MQRKARYARRGAAVAVCTAHLQPTGPVRMCQACREDGLYALNNYLDCIKRYEAIDGTGWVQDKTG